MYRKQNRSAIDIESLSVSLGTGCICPVVSLINGPILGFLLTFFSIYFFSVFLFANKAKGLGLSAYLSYLVYGSFGAIPFALVWALPGGMIIGLCEGLVCGIVGLPTIFLTTKWLPPEIRSVVVSIVMAIAGTGSAIVLVFYFNNIHEYLGLSLIFIFILEGGVLGLILGFMAAWPLIFLNKPKSRPLLTILVVTFFTSVHLLLPLLIIGALVLLHYYWYKVFLFL